MFPLTHYNASYCDVDHQIIVGPPSRADKLSQFLDANPQPFRLNTDRGFLTITGRFGGVPTSIAAIGMGSSSADFFVRYRSSCMVCLHADSVHHNLEKRESACKATWWS